METTTTNGPPEIDAEGGGVGRLIKSFNESARKASLDASLPRSSEYKSIGKGGELLSDSQSARFDETGKKRKEAEKRNQMGPYDIDDESIVSGSEGRGRKNTTHLGCHDAEADSVMAENSNRELHETGLSPAVDFHLEQRHRMITQGNTLGWCPRLPNTSIYKVDMFRFVEIATKRVLFHLAKSGTRYKCLFIIIPILLVSPCLLGAWLRREAFVDFGKLPFPYFISLPDPTTTAPSLPHAYPPYNGSNPHFDALKRTSQADFGILLSSKNRYENALSNRSISAYYSLRKAIQDLTVTHHGVDLKWSDMCMDCSGWAYNSLDFLHSNQTQFLLKYPDAIVREARGGEGLSGAAKRHFIANILGDLEFDIDGIITRAQTIQLNIKLKENLPRDVYTAFEHKLRELLHQNISITPATLNGTSSSPSSPSSRLSVSDDFSMNFWSVRKYIREGIDALTDAHLKMLACLGLAVVFCILISFTVDSYQSRPIVGMQAGLILVASVVVAYSLHIFSLGHTNMMLFPVIFVIVLGIGVLHHSSMLHSHNRYTMVALHPMEKLAFIYSWDSPCLTLSLVALIGSAVVGGLYTANVHLRHLLLTSAVGLASLCIFTCLYMTVCWVNSGRRQASGLKWYQLFKRGDETFNDKYTIDYDELTSARLHEKLADIRPSTIRTLGRLLADYNFRTVAVAIFTLYLILAILASGLGSEDGLPIELREDFFVSPSSSSSGYLRKLRSNFPRYEDYLEMEFDHPLLPVQNAMSSYQQIKLLQEHTSSIFKWAMEQQYVSRVVNWLADFEQYQRSSIYDITPETIVPVLSFVFLKTHPYDAYSSDIVFDKFQTQIIRSRVYLELTAKGRRHSGSLVNELLKRAKLLSLPPTTIKAPFLFSLHHNLQSTGAVVSALVPMIISLTVLSFTFFPQPAICLCVPFSCLATSIGCIGAASYLGVPLNIVTMSTILLGNLLTAATTIHFCYMFCNFNPTISQQGMVPARRTANIQRLQYAFQCSLMPTIYALTLPVLSYLPLLLNETPIILHIWEILVINSLLTLLNLFFALPSLVTILSDYLTAFFAAANKICGDENGTGCGEGMQPPESIYFIGAERSLRAARELNMLPYYMTCGLPLPHSHMAIMPPAYHDHGLLPSLPALPQLPAPPMSVPALPERGSVVANRRNRTMESRSPAGEGKRRVMQPNGERRTHGRGLVRETTEEESNIDTLDSMGSERRHQRRNRSAPEHVQFPPSSSASSRRHTPRHGRRQFISNVNVESEEYEPKIDSRPCESQDLSSSSTPREAREQIYEEPVESAMPQPPNRYRRSGSAPHGEGMICRSNSILGNRAVWAPRSPAARRADAIKQTTGLIYDPRAHRRIGKQPSLPSGHELWRHQLFGSGIRNPADMPSSSSVFYPSSMASPIFHRKRF